MATREKSSTQPKEPSETNKGEVGAFDNDLSAFTMPTAPSYQSTVDEFVRRNPWAAAFAGIIIGILLGKIL